MKLKKYLSLMLIMGSLLGFPVKVKIVLENKTNDTLKAPMLYALRGFRYAEIEKEIYLKTLFPGEKVKYVLTANIEKFDMDIEYKVLVKNGEVSPDIIKIELTSPSYASLSNLIITQIPEYEVHHTITEFEEVYPILFLHGNSSSLRYWLNTTAGYKEALLKILEEHYREYEGDWDESNLNIYPNTQIPTTYERSHPKRQIYNAQYYLNAPINDTIIHGVIGSNGNIVPVNPSDEFHYNNIASYGSYAERVANIVNRILEATYSDKILVVAHSMGGLVIRSAIKYYGLQGKVKRLLTIGTPNNGVSWTAEGVILEDLLTLFISFMNKLGLADISDFYHPWWMGEGEVQEIGFTYNNIRLTWDWKQGNQIGTWTYFLNQGNWGSWTRIATIAGNLNPVIPVWISIPFPYLHEIKFLDFQTSDGLVSVSDVYLPFAVFNSVYHACHGTSAEPGVDLDWLDINVFSTWGPNSLTACKYTTEYIKLWVIDGDESKDATSISPSYIKVSFGNDDGDGRWDYYDESVWAEAGINNSDWNEIVIVRIDGLLFHKPKLGQFHKMTFFSKEFTTQENQCSGNKRCFLVFPPKGIEIDPGDRSMRPRIKMRVYFYSLKTNMFTSDEISFNIEMW